MYNNDLSNNCVDISDNETIFDVLNKVSVMECDKTLKVQWNKLENSTKIQKLHIFSEKYGREKNLPTKEIKLLKTYFTECILHKNKLSKSKEVNYDKDTGIITNIPGLNYNNTSKSFTIRVTDNKRVSTLKSLTPKNKKNKNT